MYLRCDVYIISNNTIIYDYPETIECTLCEHSIVMNKNLSVITDFYFIEILEFFIVFSQDQAPDVSFFQVCTQTP